MLLPGAVYRWVPAALRAIAGSPAAPGGWIVGLRDVHDQVAAAEELAETREHYGLLAENASDLVFRANLANELERVSPAAEDLLGVSAKSLVGKLMWLGCIQTISAGWLRR